jgi:hypothetical protein
MWGVADRFVKTFADLTVGTVIVLVHVALADRQAERTHRALLKAGLDEPRARTARLSS